MSSFGGLGFSLKPRWLLENSLGRDREVKAHQFCLGCDVANVLCPTERAIPSDSAPKLQYSRAFDSSTIHESTTAVALRSLHC